MHIQFESLADLGEPVVKLLRADRDAGKVRDDQTAQAAIDNYLPRKFVSKVGAAIWEALKRDVDNPEF